ncbi:MAG: Rieske 2Fe-2S domain-containing protein, partial [Pseudomonadota bacterium]
MKKQVVAKLSTLPDREPQYALVADVDLVVVRFDEDISVFYGRCLHRGALMSDGYVDGDNLICGVHYWDYRLDSGVSEYNNSEALPKFTSWVEGDDVLVDEDEIAAWANDHPQPFNREAYLGLYADTSHGTDEEPYNGLIQQYARDGLSKTGHHGRVDAMGVPRTQLRTSSTKSLGTIILRIAVHFCPDLTVISFLTSLINKSNSGVPGTASRPKTDAFKESASIVKGTDSSIN